MLVARDDGARGSWWIVLGLGLAASACTPRERAAPTNDDELEPACAAVASEPLPVITTLITRDHEVTVHASDEGLRFTVALAGGGLLGRQLDAHELERSFPALHQRFDAMFADDAHWLDASLGGLPQAEAAIHGPVSHP
jgi:hypothetical protein